MKSHSIYRRVYYDDTDGGGVVYHANYLRYLDHARSDFLQQLGFDLQTLLQEHNIFFAVITADIRYQRPARLSDELEVTAELENFSNTGLSFRQCVLRLSDKNTEPELLVEGKIGVACLDSIRFKPVRIPKPIREKLSGVD
ncbi:MAG TPA: YbgC/FadM family acyl-CoA thioesterase [Gammaproteobacteria bacterium]